MAVKVLECEAIRNRCPVVSGAPVPTSATPSAVDSTTRSPTRTAACTPGTRSRRRWCSSQDSRWGAASAATSAGGVLIVVGSRVSEGAGGRGAARPVC